MADSNIGALPLVPSLADDSLMVVEQQGTAMRMTGAQFKEFGKQSVIAEVQGYVDDAQAAAESAAQSVSAVTDMTVEARTLDNGQPATVTKGTKNGKVNLEFGLPRGEQGIPGPEGQTGPRGPQGPAGKGLTILGYYDTTEALETAVTAPVPGDAYGVGTAAPYDIYVFDGVANTWKNNGPLSGGTGGTILPENVVTAEGGAVLAVDASLGGAPHTVTFTDEEDPPLTADDIVYSGKTTGLSAESVQEAIDGLFTSVSDGKQLIASAITDRGVETGQDATFRQMAENIGQISGGSDTSDATATPGDILAGKTAYTAAGKVEGVIPSLPAQTITPGTEAQTIANGQYLAGTQIIQGDTNLVSANIREGVSIFGVPGAMTSQFKATLTVKADVGAVVTAAHTTGAEVSALSTTGTVALELPIEGQWTVTAQRGVAQYNSVVVNVSSSYSAELTAEVHIEYFTTATSLPVHVSNLAAASVGDYALFGGGIYGAYYRNDVAGYDSNLVQKGASYLSKRRNMLAAASIGDYAIFAGGYGGEYGESAETFSTADAYNSGLSKNSTIQSLKKARYNLAATSIGKYALFGGGQNRSNIFYDVDAYSETLTLSAPTPLVSARAELAAASNENYALFGGGYTGSAYSNIVDAYNTGLTRSTPTVLSVARSALAAALAGNYVLFAGGYNGENSNVVDAYDLFLTRTTPVVLDIGQKNIAGTSLSGYALLSGSNSMDIYDSFLTHTVGEPLSESRSKAAAASIGNYALFGGGNTGLGSYPQSNIVDVYRYV